MDKQNVVPPHSGLLLSHEKERSSEVPTAQTKLGNTMLCEKEGRHRRTHIDCIYMECPEQANPQRQKVGEWLPGAGGKKNGE